MHVADPARMPDCYYDPVSKVKILIFSRREGGRNVLTGRHNTRIIALQSNTVKIQKQNSVWVFSYIEERAKRGKTGYSQSI